MSVIYFLIPIAILLLVVGVVAFMWATKNEQFEDLEKQGLSILMDDETKTQNQSSTKKPSAEDP